jgi:RNA polymerase sigma factor (sigma-70 family)
MSDAPDARLLEEFARNQSEDAFAELVRRHIGLVHSVALRHTANVEQAQDITQAVFIILARKAGSLSSRVVLPGWLYHTARLTAVNFQRAEMRRMRREQEAFMQSTLEEPASDALWRELSPLLDDAMEQLRASDHDALVLRYFQNQSLADIGAAMGIAERAAQKRVNRALEKLRKFFLQRGVSSTTATIAETISAHSIQTVPAGLAKLVTVAAIAKGATASASSLTLVKGALKIMAWTKTQTAIAVSAGLLLAAGTATFLVKKHAEANVFIPVQAPWSDAGAATPKAALETLAWALTNDKMDRAEQLMQWEETNTNYDNAPLIEHQLALGGALTAVQGIASFKILSVTSAGPEEVSVKFRKTFKQSNIMPFAVTARLKRVGHEWHVVGRIDYYPNGVSTLLPFSGSF